MTLRGILVCVFALCVMAAPLLLADYQVTLLNYVGLGSLVALGLVLMTGVGGITSFGQAAFAGISAYSTAILTTQLGWSPWIGLAAALVVSGVVAYFIGLITLHLSGHFLPLSTIAWSISLYFVAGNLAVLGRHNGLTGLPPVTVGDVALTSAASYYYLIWLFVGIGLVASHNLLASRTGRAIRCLRGRAQMAECFGVDTAQLKIVIFVYAALLAALSGWLYAHLVRFVNPTPFSLNASIEYLFMAVVGGAGSIWGAVVGAGFLTLLRDRLQDLLPNLLGTGGAVETVTFGILVLLILQRTRTGITGWFSKLLPAPPPVAIDATAKPLPVREPAASGEIILKVENVSRQFGGLTALNAVSFSLRSGEMLGLIGPNGAGKSTLFNIMTGTLAPSSGNVVFAGQFIAHRKSRAIARLGIARTFQHVRLRSDMSVLENVAMGAYLRSRDGALRSIFRLDRSSEASLLAEASRSLARVGLSDKADQAAGAISLGQQRLVEIARALAANPILLLLDEPAAGLRAGEKKALATLLRQLRNEGMTILVVEHDMQFVMNLVDRLVVLDFGEKIAEGTPAEIQKNPNVRKAYLGEAAA